MIAFVLLMACGGAESPDPAERSLPEAIATEAAPQPSGASTVQITVVDENNEPVPDVEVMLGDPSSPGDVEQQAMTLDDGTAAFSRVDYGTRSVRVRGPAGEKDVEVQFTDADQRHVIRLSADAPTTSSETGGDVWSVPVDGEATWCDEHATTRRKAMVVRSRDTDGYDIVLVGADGSIERTLVRPGDQGAPRWSPDGGRVAFHETTKAGSDVVVLDPKGRGVQRIDAGRGPSWSPDGTRLVYSRETDGNWDLWVVTLDGGEPTRLTSGPDVETDPYWARTSVGERIVYASAEKGLWSMSPKGGDVRPVVAGGSSRLSYRGPAVSPDGQWVAAWTTDGSDAVLWLAPVEGGRPTRIASPGAHPTWSTDEIGLKLYFDARTGKRSQVYWTRIGN